MSNKETINTCLICPHCQEGKLVWKRKTFNVLNWVLRIYKCDNCGLEDRQEEWPKNVKTVKVYP